MQALEQHDRKCTNTNFCLSVIIKGGWNYYSQLLWFLIKEQKRAVVVRWTDRVYSSHRFFVHSQLTLFWCSASAVENVKEVLKLSVEQKGAVLPAGELTVYLDGLTVADQEDPAPLTNGNAANGTSELGLFHLNWCLAEVRLGITDKPGFFFFFFPHFACRITLFAIISEAQQNGDTIHENGDSSSASSRAANRYATILAIFLLL